MSTTEYHDPTTSQQWQQDNANRLIAGHGTIVVKYFDAGFSRSLPWRERPAASAADHHRHIGDGDGRLLPSTTLRPGSTTGPRR